MCSLQYMDKLSNWGYQLIPNFSSVSIRKAGGGPPPPPPPPGSSTSQSVNLPPAPGTELAKSKKTIKLHWTEWKPTPKDVKLLASAKPSTPGSDRPDGGGGKGIGSRFFSSVANRGKEPKKEPKDLKKSTIWSELVHVKLDADFLQDSFENKSAEVKVKVSFCSYVQLCVWFSLKCYWPRSYEPSCESVFMERISFTIRFNNEPFFCLSVCHSFFIPRFWVLNDTKSEYTQLPLHMDAKRLSIQSNLNLITSSMILIGNFHKKFVLLSICFCSLLSNIIECKLSYMRKRLCIVQILFIWK